MERLNIRAGPLYTPHLDSEDACRIKGSQVKEDVIEKGRRQLKQSKEKCAEKACIEEEEETYRSIAF